jgi:HAE1 family hydrophobic/amphiphilic exporter-1
MNLPALAVKRPIFITSLVLLMLFTGIMSLRSLPVSLFPVTDLPFVTITTIYPGAGPKEVELSVSKYMEDELSTMEGLKKLSTISQDSYSIIWVEFKSGVNLDASEQRVRDKVAIAMTKFPREVEAPVIERFNPSNQPVITAFLNSPVLSRVELTTWAENELKPMISRVPKVGRIDIIGGQKRQIDVVINPKKMEQYRMSMLQIANGLQGAGANVPAGSLIRGQEEISLRSFAQFDSVSAINNKIVSFGNGETAVRVRDLGIAKESAEKLKSRAFYAGKQGVILQIYKQTGSRRGDQNGPQEGESRGGASKGNRGLCRARWQHCGE